jgi:hypothetical protein
MFRILIIILLYVNVYRMEYKNPYDIDRLSKQSFFIKKPEYKTNTKKV